MHHVMFFLSIRDFAPSVFFFPPTHPQFFIKRMFKTVEAVWFLSSCEIFFFYPTIQHEINTFYGVRSLEWRDVDGPCTAHGRGISLAWRLHAESHPFIISLETWKYESVSPASHLMSKPQTTLLTTASSETPCHHLLNNLISCYSDFPDKTDRRAHWTPATMPPLSF